MVHGSSAQCCTGMQTNQAPGMCIKGDVQKIIMRYYCFISLIGLIRFHKIIVKLGSCSSLLKSLSSTLKVSIQKQNEQCWHYNLRASPTHHQQLFKAGFHSLSAHKSNERTFFPNDFRNNSPNILPYGFPNDFLNEFLTVFLRVFLNKFWKTCGITIRRLLNGFMNDVLNFFKNFNILLLNLRSEISDSI